MEKMKTKTAEEKAELRKLTDNFLKENKRKFSAADRLTFEKSMTRLIEEDITMKEAMGMTEEREEYIYSKGYQLFRSGKYKEALPLFSLLYNYNRDSYRYIFAIASCQLYLKDYDAAGGNYQLASELDLLNPIPPFHQYECFMQSGYSWSALCAILLCIEICKMNTEKYSEILALAELEYKNLIVILKEWADKNEKK
jgi:type III secretion system low calcium response chaperone LcrH/SycD